MSNFPIDEIPTQFDVLVVGSGAAGLYAALCLPDHLQVGLMTRDALKMGSSSWAQGGIAAPIDPSDSPQLHLEDTLRAGVGLCDRAAVEFLVQQATTEIDALLDLGVGFDRDRDRGTLALTREAAHSRPRVLHSADTTGRAIVDTLTARVLERPNIQVIPHALALDLWIHPQTDRCQGVRLLHRSQILWVKAAAVVLATGGGGQVFAQTTNPSVSTGDGVAMAWRAGAILRDLEFFQFHPTALQKAGAPRFLISEAVRGEGGHLVDAEGKRFAFHYHPDGELAPRDVVSRAIFSHLQKTTVDPVNACVYLDLRPIERDRIHYRFPNIIQVCQKFGIDVFQTGIPVAPASHYWMGGILVNLNNRTSIPGLYAVGEVASTGVHGANRLASNSLLECLVLAKQLARINLSSTINQQQQSDSPPSEEPSHLEIASIQDTWLSEADDLQTIRQDLRTLMWKSAGVYRTGNTLNAALDQIATWQTKLAKTSISQHLAPTAQPQTLQFSDPTAEAELKLAVETRNLLDIAHLILTSAAFRTESRGGHHRIDYPETDPDWQTNTLVQGSTWKQATKENRTV